MNTSITPALITQFDIAGPRYTSYPTADRFVDAYGMSDHLLAMAQRAAGLSHNSRPLSIYVHIPFCESLCYYCACNKIVTKHHDRAARYLQYLEREIDLTVQHLGSSRGLSQLHLGGGTPSFLSDDELSQLMRVLRRHFEFGHKSELGIEIDPRTVTTARLEHLAQLGFNRVSFGVQDFDPLVQQAIHRIQPYELVEKMHLEARRIGFESINMDLIYGLPGQSSDSFSRTLDQLIQLRPDRIAVYAYAHLPDRFKPQRRIHVEHLPPASAKLAMHSQSISRLIDAGYDYIGMDHFALPTDALAQAKRLGRMHRNFQGYSTLPDSDMLGFGVSAIGRIGTSYYQNEKVLDDYYDAIDQGHLPIAKGLSLSHDDVLRRSVIMAIMCQGALEFEAIESAYLIDFQHYFAKELEQLEALQTNGLLQLSSSQLQVTPLGWYFVRGIAMVFDRYLQASQNRAKFSKLV
jgi:oxygen-independent coproporphyrinogen III oxidase